MDKINFIERLKDSLHETDYIAIKASEGCDVTNHGDWKAERQAIRDEINLVEAMTEEEFYEAYPDERKEEALNEGIEPSDEPYDIDVTEQDNGEEN